MNQRLSTIAMMACALGAEIPWSRPRPIIINGNELEDWALREEYEKIQRKESKLSKSERDRVVYRYERRQEALRIETKELK